MRDVFLLPARTLASKVKTFVALRRYSYHLVQSKVAQLREMTVFVIVEKKRQQLRLTTNIIRVPVEFRISLDLYTTTRQR